MDAKESAAFIICIERHNFLIHIIVTNLISNLRKAQGMAVFMEVASFY